MFLQRSIQEGHHKFEIYDEKNQLYHLYEIDINQDIELLIHIDEDEIKVSTNKI